MQQTLPWLHPSGSRKHVYNRQWRNSSIDRALAHVVLRTVEPAGAENVLDIPLATSFLANLGAHACICVVKATINQVNKFHLVNGSIMIQ